MKYLKSVSQLKKGDILKRGGSDRIMHIIDIIKGANFLLFEFVSIERGEVMYSSIFDKDLVDGDFYQVWVTHEQ